MQNTMNIILSLTLLVASALAYPLAESELKPSDVPLVITDYSSVAKAEDQVVHDAPHGVAGHVHDSSQSASEESSENNSTEEKPKEEVNKSNESSEESILQDGFPSSTLKPLEEKKEEKAEEKPKTEEPKVKANIVEEPKTEELKKEEPPKDLKEEKPEEKKEEIIPNLKAVPIVEKVEAIQKIEKPEAPVVSEVFPSVRSGIIPEKTDEKKDEKPSIAVEKPLALPTLKSEIPAEPAKVETAQPSEQKVEASPVVEEAVPTLKSTEKVVIPALEKVSIEKEVKSEKKERAETKIIEEIKAAAKPEDKQLEVVKVEEKKLDDIKVEASKVEEKPEDIKEVQKPAEIPIAKSSVVVKPEEKQPADIQSAKPAEVVPAVKTLLAVEERNTEKEAMPALAAVVPEIKLKPKPEIPENKPVVEEKPKVEEPKIDAKASIDEIKPEEKKTTTVTADKPSAPSAPSS